jgi:hypothetical protein
MTETEIAYRAAINVLRDTIESGRMPSGIALSPDAAELHTRAVAHLEFMLHELCRVSRRYLFKRTRDVAGDNAAERGAELFCCSIGDRRHVVGADVSEVVEQRNRAVGRRRLDANEAKRRRIARAPSRVFSFFRCDPFRIVAVVGFAAELVLKSPFVFERNHQCGSGFLVLGDGSKDRVA